MRPPARLCLSFICGALGIGCATPEEVAVRLLQSDPPAQYQQLASAVKRQVTRADYLERGGEVDSFSPGETIACPLVREEGARTLVACISEGPRPDASGGGRVRKRGYVYLTKGILGYRLLSSSVPYQNAWAEYQEGVASGSREHFRAAARILDEILAEYPTDPRALALKLRTRVELGDLDAASFVGTEARIRSQVLLADAAIIDMLRSCGRREGFDCPQVYAEQALDSPEGEARLLAALVFYNANEDERALAAVQSALASDLIHDANVSMVARLLTGVLTRSAGVALEWAMKNEALLVEHQSRMEPRYSCQLTAILAVARSTAAFGDESLPLPQRLRAAAAVWSSYADDRGSQCSGEADMSAGDCSVGLGEGKLSIGIDFKPPHGSETIPVCPLRVAETEALAQRLEAEQTQSLRRQAERAISALDGADSASLLAVKEMLSAQEAARELARVGELRWRDVIPWDFTEHARMVLAGGDGSSYDADQFERRRAEMSAGDVRSVAGDLLRPGALYQTMIFPTPEAVFDFGTGQFQLRIAKMHDGLMDCVGTINGPLVPSTANPCLCATRPTLERFFPRGTIPSPTESKYFERLVCPPIEGRSISMDPDGAERHPLRELRRADLLFRLGEDRGELKPYSWTGDKSTIHYWVVEPVAWRIVSDQTSDGGKVVVLAAGPEDGSLARDTSFLRWNRYNGILHTEPLTVVGWSE